MRTLSIDGELIDKDAIRPLILDACLEVLTIHGQDALTMSKIAEQAGIAKGTLYNYFKNKETLLLNVCDTFAQPMIDEFHSMLDSGQPIRDILTDILKKMVDTYRQYWRVIEAFLSQFGKNSLVDKCDQDSYKAQILILLARMFEIAKAEGYKLPYQPEIMAEIFDGAFCGMLRCTPNDINESEQTFPTDQDFERFVNIFLPTQGCK